MGCTTNEVSIITLALGAVATLLSALSIATDFWLFTEEKTSVGNTTHVTYVHMGFWRLCTYNTGELQYITIDGVTLQLNA